MAAYTINWTESLNGPWRTMPAVCIGEIHSSARNAEKHVLLSVDEQPFLRVDAFTGNDQYCCFNEAAVWRQFLAVGWGCSIYLIELDSRDISALLLGDSLFDYFGQFYVDDDFLLVASGTRLHRLGANGKVVWKSEELGVDGVVIHAVGDGVIRGDGEWDPPGGWEPFALDVCTGQKAK